MRNAFTMIELILVMLIMGVLTLLAFNRLSATRDDARLVKDMQNMSVCVSDASARYTSTGEDVGPGDLRACDEVKCYNITYASGGQDFIVQTNPGGADYCSGIDSLGGHLAKTYTFRGSRVSF
jgi:prepilin-type N-terminal cleavage/methylation domain-containing protein